MEFSIKVVDNELSFKFDCDDVKSLPELIAIALVSSELPFQRQIEILVALSEGLLLAIDTLDDEYKAIYTLEQFKKLYNSNSTND